jgi:hypothetical protein
MWYAIIMEKITNACNILVGNPQIKRSFGRPRIKRNDNIKLSLKRTGTEIVEYIKLSQDNVQWRTFANILMYFRVP